jgi:VWFA-related protein
MTPVVRRARVIAICVWVATGLTVIAQTPPAFRAHSHVVMLQVAVHDDDGAPAANLTKNEFRILDDGVLQEIEFFLSEDQPVAIGLVVDNSTSMAPKRVEVIAAAEAFVASGNPHDELFTVNFSTWVSLGLPEGVAFTSDRAVLGQALAKIGARGQTAMYDGLAVALAHVDKSALDRKVLIVLSDGDDNRSRVSFDDVFEQALRSNATIYAVGVFDPIEGGDRKALERLAETTGGLAFFPKQVSEVRSVLHQISVDVRHRYTIGYVPSHAVEGGDAVRTIKVAAVDPKDREPLRVRTRTGYLTPVH